MNGTLTIAEIAEQPDVFDRIRSEGWPHIRELGRAIAGRQPRFVVFVARGTSDHAALYAKYLVETCLSLPAGLASPSTMTVYDAHPKMNDVLVIAVSQSGSSPDLVEPLARARAGGAVTVAVTNSPGSPLAEAAEFHLDVLAGPERAVAATKTYTAELLTLYLLIQAIAERDAAETDQLSAQARELVDRRDEIGRIAIRYRFAEQLVTTARGYNYPTAREAALKLMETSYLICHAFSGADLLHGPMAIIDRGFPVIAIAPTGPGAGALRPVLERLRELGADTLVVGGSDAIALGTLGFRLPDAVPEILSPMVSIIPLQLLAWHLALERGGDPDQPRGLMKVTSTW
ncbi:MAG TPA: SIS domain-containing protein [Thermomicrobiales bacterium]|nr:SIS domain-containing protein [Thermomicrobiales bacterium]